mgnify:CR=1 FL=1
MVYHRHEYNFHKFRERVYHTFLNCNNNLLRFLYYIRMHRPTHTGHSNYHYTTNYNQQCRISYFMCRAKHHFNRKRRQHIHLERQCRKCNYQYSFCYPFNRNNCLYSNRNFFGLHQYEYSFCDSKCNSRCNSQRGLTYSMRRTKHHLNRRWGY